ncbi:MAG: DUF4410 domain-containing protein [Rhodospirillales bacterium]
MLAGYFLVVDPGNATERVVLGFGASGAQLTTMVRGYLMTADGLRALGTGQVDAGSGKMPGAAVPLVVTAITASIRWTCRRWGGEGLRRTLRVRDHRRRR